MEERQFNEMITQYEKLVYTICYQFTRDHHTAEDLMQDTFLSAYTHRDSCPEENPKAWVARIATNKAKDHLKSAYNRRVNTEGEGLPEDRGALFMQEERPEELVQGREVWQNVTAAISTLKAPYSDVAELYFLRERSVEEIAQLLGRPKRTIQTQLYRAKLQLRTWLEANPLLSPA